MKLNNPKTFEKWCEKNGFRAGALLDDAERWHAECDTNGGDAWEYETGRRTRRGDVETVAFEIVKPAEYDEGGDEITEATYKFLG